MFFKYFDQWRSITSNRFVLNMVHGHHDHFWSNPPLFCNFWQFNVKAATTHYPIIQKKVDELLAKGVVEPSSGGIGFYSNVFVVPKHTGGLWPILNLKHFNHYMYIPSFKMLTIRHAWQDIQCGDYAFSLDVQDDYLHICIVSIIIISYNLFGTICLISGRFYLLGWPQPLVFSLPLTKPIFFLCHCKGFHIVIYLDDILFLVHSKLAGKRACLFLCSLLVWHGLHINFSKSDFCITQTFWILGLCWDTVCMSVSLPADKLVDIQQLALSFLQNQHVTVHRVMSFLGKANYVPMATPNCGTCVMSFRVTCYMFTILPPFIFLGSFFPFLVMSTRTVISFATEASSFAISTS